MVKLLEHEGKALFREAGMRVPHGALVSSLRDLRKIAPPCAVKAQVLHGKRGKEGLIKVFEKTDGARAFARKLLLRPDVFGVLVEEKVEVLHEYYLSLMVDGEARDVVGVFSRRGGVDIEEVARKYPTEIVRFGIDRMEMLKKINVREKKEVMGVVLKLYRLMKKVDAELIEINPLVVTRKGLVALDAKVVIDDNALYRQPQFVGLRKREYTPRELAAANAGLHYVELDGNIGVIGDGAGLVMATLDSLKHAGGKAANFLDVGGGVDRKQMMKGIEIVTSKKVRGIFINLFGGVTPGEDVAAAIVHAKKKTKAKVPLVVRLNGVDQAESLRLLHEAGIECVESMDDGVRRIVKLCS
jgi:succinyl-CoA synthetase beta subunit